MYNEKVLVYSVYFLLSLSLFPVEFILVGLQPFCNPTSQRYILISKSQQHFATKNIIARLSGGRFMTNCYYFMLTGLIAL